jgi:two-component system cell cycle response regulator CtrA
MSKILIVEDELSIAELEKDYLELSSFEVEIETRGDKGLERALEGDYDLVILDLMLPDIDGFEVIRRLRSADISTPVIILSGLSESRDKVKCLEIGADDFITKPFERKELVARIQAVVRRSKGHAESILKVGRISVNLKTREVEVDNKLLHLTGKEYTILELLCLRRGATLTKDMFLNHLYGGIDEPELKIIDVFICKLRKKLMDAMDGENYIDTVWGRGYTLKDPKMRELEAQNLAQFKHLNNDGVAQGGM